MKTRIAVLIFFLFSSFFNTSMVYAATEDLNKCLSKQLEASASYWKSLLNCRITEEKKDFKEYNSDNFENNFDFDICDEKAIKKFAKKWDKAVDRASKKEESCGLGSEQDINFSDVIDSIYEAVDDLDFSYLWDEKRYELSVALLLYKASLKRGRKQLKAYAENRQKNDSQKLASKLEKSKSKFEKIWSKARNKADKKGMDFPDEYDKSEASNIIDTMVAAVTSLIFAGGIAEIDFIDPDYGAAGDEITIEGVLLGSQKGKIYLEQSSGGERFECIVKKWEMDEEGLSTIVFVVPDIEEDVYNVIVESQFGSLIEEEAFSVEQPEQPEITYIDPDFGSPGDVITIEGLFFGNETGKVFLENSDNEVITECTVTEWGMTEDEVEIIVFIVPDIEEGFYNVIVENIHGIAIEEEGFTVEPPLEPSIDLIDPDFGIPGDEITLEGTNLGIETGKVFLEQNGLDYFECAIIDWTMDEEGFSTIVFGVPDSVEGLYNVVVDTENGTIIQEEAFTVEAP
jgi:hypothetical protein